MTHPCGSGEDLLTSLIKTSLVRDYSYPAKKSMWHVWMRRNNIRVHERVPHRHEQKLSWNKEHYCLSCFLWLKQLPVNCNNSRPPDSDLVLNWAYVPSKYWSRHMSWQNIGLGIWAYKYWAGHMCLESTDRVKMAVIWQYLVFSGAQCVYHIWKIEGFLDFERFTWSFVFKSFCNCTWLI